MNCRRARGLIDHLLDGTLDDRVALDEHLERCGACRSVFARLQRVQDAVSRSVRLSPDEARLDRITAGILAGVQERETHVPPAPGRLRWASVAAAAILAAFALGLGMGRAVWPREMVVTKVVPKREVVEKVVEVEVPVIEERVVVREVPVVRTRVVYRDRPSPPQPAPEVSGQPLVPTQVVKADELVVSLNANLVSVHPVVSREIHPVTLVREAATQPDEPQPEGNGEEGARSDGVVGDVMFAQNAQRAD